MQNQWTTKDVLEFGITSPVGVLQRLERLSLSLVQKYLALFLENQEILAKIVPVMDGQIFFLTSLVLVDIMTMRTIIRSTSM